MPEPGFLRAVEVLTDALLTPQEFARHKPAANQMEMKWITVHPHGEGEEGRRIQINTKTGEIEKGFGAGKTMHEAFAPRSETPAATEAEEFKSPFHGDEESRHWYGANNRPIGHATVPRGFVETKNHDAFRHGAVAYPQPLSDKDQYDYELTPIHGDEAIPELAKKLGGEMDKYASQYADPDNDSILDDFLGQEKSRKLLGHVDRDKLKAEFRKQFGQPEEEAPEPQKPEDAILSKYPSLAAPEPSPQDARNKQYQTDNLKGILEAQDKIKSLTNQAEVRFADGDHVGGSRLMEQATEVERGLDSRKTAALMHDNGTFPEYTSHGVNSLGGSKPHGSVAPVSPEIAEKYPSLAEPSEPAKDDRLTPQGAIRGLKSKIADTESRIPKLEAAITKESGKEYKSNSGRIAKKDQFGEYVGEQSIGDVNEKRRANKVESLKRQLAEAKSDLGSYRNQLENLVRQHGDPDAPPPGEVDKDGYPVFSKEEDDDLRNFLLGGGDEKPQSPSLPPEIAAKYPSLAETPKEPESARDRANRQIFEQSVKSIFDNAGDTGFVQGDAAMAKRIAEKFGAKQFDAGTEFQKQLREASDAAGAKWDAVQRAMVSEDPELRRKAGVLCNRAWKKVADQINGDTGKLVIHGMDDVVNQPGLADATGSILGAGFRGNNRPDESAIIVSGKGVGVPPGRRQIVEHDQEKSAAWDSLQESIEKQRMEKEAAEAPKRELERQKKEADESARQAKEKDEADRSEAARLKVHSELMDTVDKMKPGKDFVPPKTITKKFRKELETSIALASDNRNPEMLKEAADRWIAKFATPKSPEAAIAEKYPSLADAPEKSGQVSLAEPKAVAWKGHLDEKPLGYKQFIAAGNNDRDWEAYSGEVNARSREKHQSAFISKWKSGEKLNGNDVAMHLKNRGVELPPDVSRALQDDDTTITATSVSGRGMSKSEAAKIHRAVNGAMTNLHGVADAGQVSPSPEKSADERKPFKPEGIPGEQMGLFDQDAGGQKSLFNVVKPDKKSKKTPAAAPSELEKIGDEHKARSEESAPLPGQKSIEDEPMIAGMTLDEAADLASRHHPEDRQSLRDKIQKRPSAWVQALQGYQAAEKTQRSSDAKESRDSKWKPNEGQQKVLDLIQKHGGKFDKDRDYPMKNLPGFEHKAANTQALLKRGLLERHEMGDKIHYTVNQPNPAQKSIEDQYPSLKGFSDHPNLKPMYAPSDEKTKAGEEYRNALAGAGKFHASRVAAAEAGVKAGHTLDEMLQDLKDEGVHEFDAKRIIGDAFDKAGKPVTRSDQPKPRPSADDWKPENHVKIAADDISKLRKQDVYRLMENATGDRRAKMADYIRQNRPELAGEVQDSLDDLGGDSSASKDSPSVYEIRVKGQDGNPTTKHAVAMRGKPGFGDSVFNSREEAESHIKKTGEINRLNAEYQAKQDVIRKTEQEKEHAEKTERESIDGFANDRSPRDKANIIKTLNAKASFDGKVMSVKDKVRDLVANGESLSADEENKIKPMTRTQFNRADGREQDAHEKRMREGGKKTVYRIGGYDLGKTAYDYAKHLLSQGKKEFSRRAPHEELIHHLHEAMNHDGKCCYEKEEGEDDIADHVPADHRHMDKAVHELCRHLGASHPELQAAYENYTAAME